MPLTGLYPDFLLDAGSGTVVIPFYIKEIQATYQLIRSYDATYSPVSEYQATYQLVKEYNG